MVKLAKELQNKGHQVCAKTVYNLLQKMGYSLQSNRKTEEGTEQPAAISLYYEQSHPVSAKTLSSNFGGYKEERTNW